jgi:A/G-specific adenine glycosylase
VRCARLRETTRGFDPLAERVGRGIGPIAFPARGSGRLGPQPHDGSLDIASFRQAVLGWFDAHGRHFPFRGTTNPYLVLVSETLLQQTQISRGGPAWVTFTGQFPTVDSLAAATPAAVLRAWQGLGYNRRAINLQRAARIIVGELGGAFPRDVAGLERLPGVGPYTARAVASIAYRTPVGAVDTNVRRVLSRVLAGDPGGLTARELQAAADSLVDPEQPDAWTHALMDIGSTLCRPARPRCPECPVASFCRYAKGEPAAPRPAGAAAGRARQPPAGDFRATTRWLRGRILDRLREAPVDAWSSFEEPIGEHDLAAIETSLWAMARDGLVELTTRSDPLVVLARLPIA